MTESADLSGATVTDLTPVRKVPSLYLACPLTGHADRAEEIKTRVGVVEACIAEFTDTTGFSTEPWHVNVYAPVNHTSPWEDDYRNPEEIFEINLQALTESDGLIVVAHQGSSAGIGQEIEWARCMNIPILYLSIDEPSRQIRGIPHAITFARYIDEDDLRMRVHEWLEANRPAIQNGPQRRSNRKLAFLPFTAALSQAWHRSFNKTDTAARVGLRPAAVTSLLDSPVRLAVAPFATVLALANELGVPIGRRTDLRLAHARAFVQAADAGGWDDDFAERVLFYALLRASAHDLTSAEVWTDLCAQMDGE